MKNSDIIDIIDIEDAESSNSDEYFTDPSSICESNHDEHDAEIELEVLIPEESNISKKLSDSTTKTVIVMVLCLMVIQSACDSSTYIDVVHVHKQALA
jgi:hypothetical protein